MHMSSLGSFPSRWSFPLHVHTTRTHANPRRFSHGIPGGFFRRRSARSTDRFHPPMVVRDRSEPARVVVPLVQQIALPFLPSNDPFSRNRERKERKRTRRILLSHREVHGTSSHSQHPFVWGRGPIHPKFKLRSRDRCILVLIRCSPPIRTFLFGPLSIHSSPRSHLVRWTMHDEEQ